LRQLTDSERRTIRRLVNPFTSTSKRLGAAILYEASKGVSEHQIASNFHLSTETVSSYIGDFNSNGLAVLERKFPKHPKRWGRKTRLLFLVLGIFFCGGAFYLILSNTIVVFSYQKTDATIVAISDNSRCAVIQFQTQGGDKIETVSDRCNYSPKNNSLGGRKVGDHFDIYYNRDNPQITRPDDFGILWIAPFIGLVVGMVMLWMAVSPKS
jgi:hypothetical protein